MTTTTAQATSNIIKIFYSLEMQCHFLLSSIQCSPTIPNSQSYTHRYIPLQQNLPLMKMLNDDSHDSTQERKHDTKSCESVSIELPNVVYEKREGGKPGRHNSPNNSDAGEMKKEERSGVDSNRCRYVQCLSNPRKGVESRASNLVEENIMRL
jgi:hypothetical protein